MKKGHTNALTTMSGPFPKRFPALSSAAGPVVIGRSSDKNESLLLALAFDVFDRVADGGQLFRVFVRNIRAEFFFQRHHQLNLIERIRAQVFDEFRFRVT